MCDLEQFSQIQSHISSVMFIFNFFWPNIHSQFCWKYGITYMFDTFPPQIKGTPASDYISHHSRDTTKSTLVCIQIYPQDNFVHQRCATL